MMTNLTQKVGVDEQYCDKTMINVVLKVCVKESYRDNNDDKSEAKSLRR